MQFEIAGITVEVAHKPIKNIYLRILPPEGTVVLTAPLKVHESMIQDYLQKKATWIVKKRQQMMHNTTQLSPKYETGAVHYFLGIPYPLTILDNTGPMRLFLQENQFYCFVKTIHPFLIKDLFLNWYKKEMQRRIPEFLARWEPIIGVKVHSWGLKKMKTRWGSCNTRTKKIWLNLYLIQYPLQCLEYVLVHEMVHLLEASHNKRFYTLMTLFLPNWKECQKYLTQFYLSY